MNNTKFSTPSRLIILGNGFDLSSNLHSSFLDYVRNYYDHNIANQEKQIFDEFDNMAAITCKQNEIYYSKKGNNNSLQDNPSNVELLPLKILLDSISKYNLSFWDYVLLFNKQNHLNWQNVEKLIFDFFSIYVNNIEKTLVFFGKGSTNNESPLFVDKNSKSYLFFSCVIKEMTATNPFSGTKELYDFLYKELLKFEDHFKNYLSNEVSKTNSYLAKANERIDKLTNNEQTNILSFNYTSPFKDSSNIVNFRNVHGDLDHHCIIGIDQISINGNDNHDDDEYNYRFTKTYRIMQLASDRQEKHILDKNIKSVVFYGHSLAAADYSYFQSIFDFYNIYDSDVTLVFYYSIYNENKEEQIIKTQFDSIRKLLLEYGDTLDNKDHGKNLLHKLLLEDRLIIKELALDDSTHEQK